MRRFFPAAAGVWRLPAALLAAAALSAGVFVLTNAATGRYQIDGPSMAPTLRRGEYVLIAKARAWWPKPMRGQMVVFRRAAEPGRDYIKRLIALPGDTIEISSGKVAVDGLPVSEPYRRGNTSGRVPERRLGPDEYFLLGDDRPASRDSRHFGAIHRVEMIGRALIVYWPPPRWGAL